LQFIDLQFIQISFRLGRPEGESGALLVQEVGVQILSWSILPHATNDSQPLLPWH